MIEMGYFQISHVFFFNKIVALCQWDLEYAYFISCKRNKITSLLHPLPPKKKGGMSGYDAKLYPVVNLQLQSSGKYGFILLFTLNTTLAWSSNIYQGCIFGSNKTVGKLLVFCRNAWNQKKKKKVIIWQK